MTDSIRRASMADVARLAGVSGQTVSRVANGSARVDPGTRERVEAAMQELGYRMHRAARALRTGRTRTIGVLAATLATEGNSRMLTAVAEAAARHDLALAVMTVAGEEAIDDAFERLRDQGIDGAIVLNEAAVFAQDAEVPDDLDVVVVDSRESDRFDVVVSDHAGGAREATRRLITRGAPVWHVAGPPESFAARERERGWRAALAAAGVAAPAVVRGDWSSASGHAAAAALPADIRAVFVGNDQMALGLIRGLAERGLRIPEDVAVVGFDDVADAAQYRPPLTTVRQDFDALGARAVELLVERIEAPRPPRWEQIPTALVLRESG